MVSVIRVDAAPAHYGIVKKHFKEGAAFRISPALFAPEALTLMEPDRFSAGNSGYHVPGTGGIAPPNVFNHDVSCLFCAGTGVSEP
jgi:hypothetical protein